MPDTSIWFAGEGVKDSNLVEERQERGRWDCQRRCYTSCRSSREAGAHAAPHSSALEENWNALS